MPERSPLVVRAEEIRTLLKAKNEAERIVLRTLRALEKKTHRTVVEIAVFRNWSAHGEYPPIYSVGISIHEDS